MASVSLKYCTFPTKSYAYMMTSSFVYFKRVSTIMDQSLKMPNLLHHQAMLNLMHCQELQQTLIWHAKQGF